MSITNGLTVYTNIFMDWSLRYTKL